MAKKKTAKKKQTTQDIKKKLWQAANKLRNSMDAAEYKHVVLGLIFLKYVSDSFNQFREQLKKNLTDPSHEYFLGGGHPLKMLRKNYRIGGTTLQITFSGFH